MVDQKQSNFYVVYTLLQIVVTLLREIVWVLNQYADS